MFVIGLGHPQLFQFILFMTVLKKIQYAYFLFNLLFLNKKSSKLSIRD